MLWNVTCIVNCIANLHFRGCYEDVFNHVGGLKKLFPKVLLSNLPFYATSRKVAGSSPDEVDFFQLT
jgi:hypothetical protein